MSIETHAPETRAPIPTGWYDAAGCSLAELRAFVEVSTRLEDYPHADAVVENVLVYGAALTEAAARRGQPASGAGRAGPRADVRPGSRGLQAGLRPGGRRRGHGRVPRG